MLTRQLLAFSRRQHLSPEVLDVRPLVGGFEALLRRAIGESVTLEVLLPDEPVVCEVDAFPAGERPPQPRRGMPARLMPDGGRLDIEHRRAL